MARKKDFAATLVKENFEGGNAWVKLDKFSDSDVVNDPFSAGKHGCSREKLCDDGLDEALRTAVSVNIIFSRFRLRFLTVPGLDTGLPASAKALDMFLRVAKN